MTGTISRPKILTTVRCRISTPEPPYWRAVTLDHDIDAASRFGVLYTGESPACAFIETYGRLSNHPRLVTRAELGLRHLARLVPLSPLRVVDLTEAGSRRIDADNRLCTGDYRVAQR